MKSASITRNNKDWIALVLAVISGAAFIIMSAVHVIWLPIAGTVMAIIAFGIKFLWRSASDSTPVSGKSALPKPQNPASVAKDQKQDMAKNAGASLRKAS